LSIFDEVDLAVREAAGQLEREDVMKIVALQAAASSPAASGAHEVIRRANAYFGWLTE
jgi:hypothetical protein